MSDLPIHEQRCWTTGQRGGWTIAMFCRRALLREGLSCPSEIERQNLNVKLDEMIDREGGPPAAWVKSWILSKVRLDRQLLRDVVENPHPDPEMAIRPERIEEQIEALRRCWRLYVLHEPEVIA